MPAPDPNSDTPRSLQSEANRLADAARDRASDALEEVKLASNQVVDKVRELIEDANVKRVTIKREDKVLLEIPLTVGVGAGAAALLLNPVLSAVGALAALVADVTLVIERTDGAASGTVQNVNDPEPSADSDAKTVGRPSSDDDA